MSKIKRKKLTPEEETARDKRYVALEIKKWTSISNWNFVLVHFFQYFKLLNEFFWFYVEKNHSRTIELYIKKF